MQANQIFQAIGPAMFGYLLARNSYTHKFDFEESLADLIRREIIDEVEARKIDIVSADVDTIVLQFKQLGYIMLSTNDKKYTGWTLTPKGEAQLTRLKTSRRKKSK